ncbi:MAG: ribonuclease HII [Candidatus Wildermuthbacteria bacterium]|nr:ribonuclease HII [Candidatus Wildermuthbacteria bacterium]
MRLTHERKLWKQGFKVVAGIDEAGRGPLAGPVVACALCVKPGFKAIAGVRDSKMLSPKQREFLCGILKTHQDIAWGIGIVSEKDIDRVNIFQATKQAMSQAVHDLSAKLRTYCLNVGILVIDGNSKIDLPLPQITVVKGDQKVFSCAAASIIAKVTRDKLMDAYHAQYPQYGFQKHKGYGTKAHLEKLKLLGPSPVHRMSFSPLRLANAGNL